MPEGCFPVDKAPHREHLGRRLGLRAAAEIDKVITARRLSAYYGVPLNLCRAGVTPTHLSSAQPDRIYSVDAKAAIRSTTQP